MAPSKNTAVQEQGGAVGLALLAGLGLVFLLGRSKEKPPLPPDDAPIFPPEGPRPGGVIISGAISEVTVAGAPMGRHLVTKSPGDLITVNFSWDALTVDSNGNPIDWTYRIRTLIGHDTLGFISAWKEGDTLGFPEFATREVVFQGADGWPGRHSNTSVAFIAPDDPGVEWDVKVRLQAAKSDDSGRPIAGSFEEIAKADHLGALKTTSGSARISGSLGVITVSQAGLAVPHAHRLLGRSRRR